MYSVDSTVDSTMAFIGASDDVAAAGDFVVVVVVASSALLLGPPPPAGDGGLLLLVSLAARPSAFLLIPSRENTPGSHPLFAAATAMRPATKEFPSREPATTRQISIADIMPKTGPSRRVIAVLAMTRLMSVLERDNQGGRGELVMRIVFLTTATLSVVETTFQGRRM